MTRLGYSPAASRSEQVRWLVSRCEPFLLVMLSVHYLVRTSVWPVSIPVLIAAIAGLALGLFGAVYPTNSRLGVLRATVAHAAADRDVARPVASPGRPGAVVLDPGDQLSPGVRSAPGISIRSRQRDRRRCRGNLGLRRHVGSLASSHRR